MSRILGGLVAALVVGLSLPARGQADVAQPVAPNEAAAPAEAPAASPGAPPAAAAPATLPAPAPMPGPSLESGLVSLADKSGFRFQTRAGDFLLSPYVLVQAHAGTNVVDDEGLDLAEVDDFANLGFGLQYALLGMAGRAFGIVEFNLALNAACGGSPCLLNQAWADIRAVDGLRVRLGKFKTPLSWAYQVRVGQAALPRVPTSMASRVNVPFDLNASNPTLATGMDVGAMVHGLLSERFEYQVGVFNGEGMANTPSSSLGDDDGLPGLLYGARLAFMPFGPMPLSEACAQEGCPTRLVLGAGVSYEVEANAETSNDLRANVQLAGSRGPLYWAVEAYLLHMRFVERQRGEPQRLFWGAYGQLACRLGPVEPVVRFEVFDRNSADVAGVLLLPTVGLNWYLAGQNLKVQGMYQFLAKAGHEGEFEANDDDNGLAEHTFLVQLQFVL